MLEVLLPSGFHCFILFLCFALFFSFFSLFSDFFLPPSKPGEKRLSNDIQNDDVWSQSEQLAANNEGHHSAAGAGAASAFSLLAPQYFRLYLFSTTFTFTFTLSISISMTTTATAFAFLLLSVLNCTFYSRL